MLKIAIAGAAGRMGRSLLKAMLESGAEFRLRAATAASGDPLIGLDAGLLATGRSIGVAIADSLAHGGGDSDVLIDFTCPEALAGHVEHCRDHGCAMVVGTTGLGPEHAELLASAAQTSAVLHSPNMSIGANVGLALLGEAARALGDDFDVEIVEAHHRHKKDAPSGTALAMGRSVAEALGREFDQCAVYGRQGIGAERNRQTIGFATVRGGEIVGEHTVIFAGSGEQLEIVHKAGSRMAFAHGALRTARWLANKPPGMYSMADMLGNHSPRPESPGR